MILPIYSGELIEVHHVFARGAEGGEFRITITLNINKSIFSFRLGIYGYLKNKNKMTPNLNQLIDTCKCKSK